MKKLEYFLDKFYEISDKIGKHNVMLIAFIVIVVIITGLYSTFSIFTSTDGVEVVDGITTYKFVLDPTLSVSSIIVPANTEKNLDVVVTNSESMKLKYGLHYSATGEVTIGYTSTTTNPVSGVIDANGVYIVSLKVNNATESNITVSLGLAYGFESGGDLVLPDGSTWIGVYPYISEDGTNLPNIDDGNLIPVYYDDVNEVWKKADWSNVGSTWYNYDERRWANAVMISDESLRSTYQEAGIGTIIPESDVTAFMVWIPRFKYNVWNITRQGGNESAYAYAAYTNGINIEFEVGTANTGNVACTYDTSSGVSEEDLSDTCIYNGTDTITPESGNANYASAWYTHPAFTFGGEEKTGFWIGKFETTGTATAPTVLPDTTALVNQTVSAQFTTSKVFQTYGLSDGVDAHMLTNLEWGAVAYLTHSIYGLCDGTSCRDAYINNSSSMYTGRSAGVLAANSSYDAYGTYNYKGYSMDSSTGSPTTTKDSSLVASTTGNVTGVYDIVGGASEYVMGNMVDSSNAFYPSSSGTSWNGSTTLSTFYYNAYSYGDTYVDQTAFNRAILGDATAEVTGSSGSYMDAWQPGTGITGSGSIFVVADYPWFARSGYYGSTAAGSFLFTGDGGSAYSSGSFRQSIS